MNDARRTARALNSMASPDDESDTSGPLTSAGSAHDETDPEECRMSVSTYVEAKFIPGHVMLKTRAGRIHYQALLKHILSPELVAGIFARYGMESKNKMTAISGWPYFDETRLCDVNPDRVRELIDCATAQGYSPQTIKHIKNVISAIFSHAQSEGAFKGHNPASEITLQRTIHRAPRNITFQQAKAIVEMLDGPEREIALLSLTTGLSAVEICKLQWKHVNSSDVPIMCEGEMIPPRCILIQREAAPGDSSSASTSRTKTVDIPDALFRRLLRTRRLQQHSRPEAFVLALRGAARPSGVSVSRTRLVRVGRQLGIPWLSWQVLKRGHQALLAELRDQLSCNLVGSAR